MPGLETQLGEAIGDPEVEALLGRLVAPTVEKVVRQALAEHATATPRSWPAGPPT